MTTDDDSIDLQHALRRGHDLAVLEDGRTVPMRRDADGDARLYYAADPGLHNGWYYRATGRWCAEHGDAETRERHPRVVATLATGRERPAGADDEIVLDDTTSPETARKIGRLALRYGMNPNPVTGDDEPDPLQLGDYVVLDDLDGPEHLARVAQAMLTGYPGARRNDETRYALDDTGSARSDWSVHRSDRLAVVIDPRAGTEDYGAVWSVPVCSDALHRRRSPDDVLRAGRGRAGTRVNGRRVVTPYPEPDDEVAITFVDAGGTHGPRVVRATGRDFDGTPCVWLDGDDAFRWHGDRFTYRGEHDVVLVWLTRDEED